MRVIIFGANGMLGSMLFRILSNDPTFSVLGLARSKPYNDSTLKTLSNQNAQWSDDLDLNDDVKLKSILTKFKPQIAVNCVGVISRPKTFTELSEMIAVNSIWPHYLANLMNLYGVRLIQISSDGVFSGRKGYYSEDDLPDPIDQYGRSKLLGELTDPHCLTLRMSIIGKYSLQSNQLVDWILRQSNSVVGFKNAIFSGLTTFEISKIIRDLIIPDTNLSGVWHLAAQPISKFDLIKKIIDRYSLGLLIEQRDQPIIDRSLNASRFTARTGYVAPSWTSLIDNLDGWEEMPRK